MFSPLRNRFGIPGVISVIALVFAMMGGAYAASSNSGTGKATASAKAKKGPRGPKGATGPPGPAGPAGPAGAKGDTGAAGANGKDGTNGTNGKDGTNGTNGAPGAKGSSVLNGTGAPPSGLGANGDFYIDTAASEIYGPKAAGAWGSGTSLKGKEGSPWTLTGTLPSGKTETGAFSLAGRAVAFESFRTPASFSVPLSSPLDEEHVLSLEPGYNGEDQVGTEHEKCPGKAASPKAKAGYLCVYLGDGSGLFANQAEILNPAMGIGGGGGSSVSGAGIQFSKNGTEGEFEVDGTFAVTAP
ncbi:MAG TPA: hypothetical protein VLK56_09350 [Solirubrobacterales bacterium]|nr:hypothetical protein [Solirubrobacterales bacterium]